MQTASTQRSTLVVPTDEVNSMGSLTSLLEAVFQVQSIRFALNRRNAETKLLTPSKYYMHFGRSRGERLLNCYTWSLSLYGAQTWTLRKVDQKYLERFGMRCCRRMEKITWTDRVRNEEVLHWVEQESNILHAIKRKKDNWIGHILHRNFLLKHIIIGKTEGMARRERRRKQLLYYFKEKEDIDTGSTKSQSVDNSPWKRVMDLS